MATTDKTSPIERLLNEMQTHLLIDANNLHIANAQQSELQHRVTRAWVLELSKRDAAKQQAKETEAEVFLEVREDNLDDKGKALPETTLKMMVTADERVKEIESKVLELTRNARLLEAMKEAFEQRGYRLSDLKDLWLANAYGDKIGDARRAAAANDIRSKQDQQRARRADSARMRPS